ncbi:unnamed protein product [Psylliodes chrysocephalus]|uniref:Uncharacterized protein n=1 Tax=Psylliodes chrysocephalus TaxID=3402493 RepID=A0A9P0D0D4_9CUCU|nr:unnamed protein product [Psylliodes chrysocephala]
MNELPLRHIFQYLDGKTSEPREYSGAIGKMLESCEKLPVLNFVPIVNPFPELDAAIMNLSTDQKHLYEMCYSISRGNCSLDLAARNPGQLSHARWLTKANRILHLYIGSKCPSTNLKTIAEFVVKVYAPVWFDIKRKSSCCDGGRHVFRMIQLSRYLNNELKVVIDPVIKRNAYFCHPENLLLAMLSDDRPTIRQLGLRRIMKVRTKISTDVREFVIPGLEFDASEYYELIDCQNCSVTAPPPLSTATDGDIREIINDTCPVDFFVLFLPYTGSREVREDCNRSFQFCYRP